MPFPAILDFPPSQPALVDRRLHPQRATSTLFTSGPRLHIHHQFKICLGNFILEIETAVEVSRIDARVHRVEQKLFSMHSAGAMVSGVSGRAHPLEISDLV